MGRLVDAENYSYVILLDGDAEGERASEKLVSEGITPDNILSIQDILGIDGNATIEDLFAKNFLAEIASNVHDIPYDDLDFPDDSLDKNITEVLNGEIKRITESSESGFILDKAMIAERICNGLLNNEFSLGDLGLESTENFADAISMINELFAGMETGGEKSEMELKEVGSEALSE